jgi:hypothetical protein
MFSYIRREGFKLSTMRSSNQRHTLAVVDGLFAVCRLDPDALAPSWASQGMVTLTRTPHETSIVCPQQAVPPGIACEREWACLEVRGPLPFSLTGVLSSLLDPLTGAGISVFVISTYATDYIFVKNELLPRAINALRTAGHMVPGYAGES